MNLSNLRDAREEARRFMKAVNGAIFKIEDEGIRAMGCKETAACRRASLDLTRALADMRK